MKITAKIASRAGSDLMNQDVPRARMLILTPVAAERRITVTTAV
jgi:hypothetical protein